MTPKRLAEIRNRNDRRPLVGVASELFDALEAERTELACMKRYYRKPTHGPCCTCQACGQHYDDCRCALDDVADKLEAERLRLDTLAKLRPGELFDALSDARGLRAVLDERIAEREKEAAG